MRASLYMVMSLLLCVDSRVIYVIYCVVRGVRLKLRPKPLGGSAISFLVVPVALLLRSARYRTGIGRTDRVGGHIILELLDGIRGVHERSIREVSPIVQAAGLLFFWPSFRRIVSIEFPFR
jgi:hypothetical protein